MGTHKYNINDLVCIRDADNTKHAFTTPVRIAEQGVNEYGGGNTYRLETGPAWYAEESLMFPTEPTEATSTAPIAPVDPVALLMQLVADIDATMANAPQRGPTETPVARMRRLEQWHDTVAAMMTAFKTNAEAAISGSNLEFLDIDNVDVIHAKYKGLFRQCAEDAFDAGVAYGDDMKGEDDKDFPEWWNEYTGGGPLTDEADATPQPWKSPRVQTEHAYLDIVFSQSDDPLTPPEYVFVEVEDPNGLGVNAGEWIDREDGYRVLRIPGAIEGGQEPGAVEINKSGTTPWRYSLHDLVIRVMGAKLNANQLNTLKMLDAGRTCAVIDCMGVQLRLRKDRSENTVEPHRMPTSGDITVDIERFITQELPALTRRHTLQDFADDLFIYLQKRTWPDHLIWPAIDKTLTIFAQVQAGEIEPTGKTAVQSDGVPGVGRAYDEDKDERAAADWVNGPVSSEWPGTM